MGKTDIEPLTGNKKALPAWQGFGTWINLNSIV
jgi:hypothetical protein